MPQMHIFESTVEEYISYEYRIELATCFDLNCTRCLFIPFPDKTYNYTTYLVHLILPDLHMVFQRCRRSCSWRCRKRWLRVELSHKWILSLNLSFRQLWQIRKVVFIAKSTKRGSLRGCNQLEDILNQFLSPGKYLL